MPISAIIALALQLLPLITSGVPEFIAWISSLKSAAQQAGEWTPEQEAAYRAALFAKTNDPAYQPDRPSEAAIKLIQRIATAKAAIARAEEAKAAAQATIEEVYKLQAERFRLSESQSEGEP